MVLSARLRGGKWRLTSGDRMGAFVFKPFEEMTPEDYAAIGLMGGLEVHQQLRTRRKLFCRCPAGRYGSDYDAEVLRHMRPTPSELGEYDRTALMEKKTRKNIYYRIHHETVCTYEFDDTPPFFPDGGAVDIALEIALLLNLTIVGEMHIARKQYLDGSIPTGFQRTTILGVEGWLPYRGRRIGIRQLSLEEDSCREVSDEGHDRVLLTDRLGMPLVEAVTDPDMRTPQEIADVCQIIRLVCRSTGKVRTGYGAAREDVNVSVRGGTRAEIKGVPQISRIPLLVYNEAMRQCALLHIRDELKRRGVTPDTFESATFDVTRQIARTKYPPIREAIQQGHRVRCVVLRGFAGLLNHPTQEHTTFAKEFSDRVRVIACLSRLPNLVHSDTAADLLAVRDWKELGKRTNRGGQDALILVWGCEADVRTACDEIVIRAREATQGVPNDTRQALKDGTTGFERVLPGTDRVFPDTDLPPMAISTDRVERIRDGLPVRVWERQEWYRSLGLPDDVIEPLCVSPRAELFQRIVVELGVDPVFAAVVLVQRFKAWRRDGLDPAALSDAEVFEAFNAYADGRLTRAGVVHTIAGWLQRPPQECTAAGQSQTWGHPPMAGAELDRRIADLLLRTRQTSFRDSAARLRHLTGRLIRESAGRADGREAAERLARALTENQPRRRAEGGSRCE